MKSFRHFLFIFFSVATLAAQAQLDIAMQQLTMTYQRSYTNPALVPDVKFHLGLPVMSYISGSVNTGIRANDLFKIEGDVLKVNISAAIDNLQERNSFMTAFSTDLLSLGFKAGKGFVLFNVTERMKADFSYSKDFFDFIYYGNGASLGKEMKFDFGINAVEYSEIGLGYGRSFKDKLFVAAKVKYYLGKMSIETRDAFFHITTAEDDFTITATSNLDLNTSIPNEDMMDIGKILTGNTGYGVDLGAVYKLNHKLSFSMSIIDIGYIKWKENITNLSSRNKEAKFVYSGLDPDIFFSDSTSLEDDLEVLQDSLMKLFEIDQHHYAYKQAMPMQAYLGAKYKFTKHLSAGATISCEKFRENFYPGFSIYGLGEFGKIMNLVLTYSIYRNSFTNLGIGTSFNLGPFQWYIATNNALGLITPLNSKYFDIRTGMNLTFARHKGFNH